MQIKHFAFDILYKFLPLFRVALASLLINQLSPDESDVQTVSCNDCCIHERFPDVPPRFGFLPQAAVLWCTCLEYKRNGAEFSMNFSEFTESFILIQHSGVTPLTLIKATESISLAQCLIELSEVCVYLQASHVC